jgi:hypothetical protein
MQHGFFARRWRKTTDRIPDAVSDAFPDAFPDGVEARAGPVRPAGGPGG